MWSDAEIREFFDSHWHVTIAEIARLAGRSRAYVKRILLAD